MSRKTVIALVFVLSQLVISETFSQDTDKVARIGNMQVGAREYLLEKKIPVALPDTQLPLNHNKNAVSQSFRLMATKEELEAELSELWKEHLMYLEDYGLEISETRKKIVLEGFDWRIEEEIDISDFSQVLLSNPNWVIKAGDDKTEDSGGKHMTLKAQMEFAGHNLLNSLEPEENYLPYWLFNEKDEGWFRPNCQGHNIGRVWDALLRLEEATGFKIPREVEAGLLTITWEYCDNPSGILLDHPDHNDARNWYIHSYRETLLTFNALVRFRNSRKAAKAGHIAIERMSQASTNLNQWNFQSLPQPFIPWQSLTYTHGRAIEGLVWFYEATGDPTALNEAGRLASFHLKNTVNPDGSLANGCGHHTHSYLNTLRGLILYGELTHQKNYIDVVEATYHNAVQKMISRSGFISHDIDPINFGEVASAGDVAQIALWLWRNNRDPELLDDVERIVRARLLPSQIIQGPEHHLGALGGVVGVTSGKTAVTDITAATLHSLIDVYNNIVHRNQTDIRVNFHFDYKDAFVSVTSNRKSNATLTVDIHGKENLFIRIPGWSPASSVKVKVNGSDEPVVRHGAYIFVSGRKNGLHVTLNYALPKHIETEVADREYRFKWRGDDIIGASPVDKDFPFYFEMD